MEGNCYSWLCRLMNTLFFSQHHTLKIQVGQVVPGGLPLPPPPSVPAHGPLGGDVLEAGGAGQALIFGAGRRSRACGSGREDAAQQPGIQPVLSSPSLDGAQGRPRTG